MKIKKNIAVFTVIAVFLSAFPFFGAGAQSALIAPGAEADYIYYEIEQGELAGGAFTASDLPDFSGSGYVNIAGGSVTMRIDVPYEGHYDVYIAASADRPDAKDAAVNCSMNDSGNYLVLVPVSQYGQWAWSNVGTEKWTDGVLVSEPPAEGYYFFKGENTVTLSQNWGNWAYFDRVILYPKNLTVPEDDPAYAVMSAVDKLPESVLASDREQVQEVKTAFDRLEPTQKIAVYNREKLSAAFESVRGQYSQEYTVKDGTLVYEAEKGMLDGAFPAEEEGLINIKYGTVYLDIDVPLAGNYRIELIGSTGIDGKEASDIVKVNGDETVYLTYYAADSFGKLTSSFPGTEKYENDHLSPLPPENGFEMSAGRNSVVLTANWGNDTLYDRLVLTPVEEFERGDVNADDTVNVLDLIRLKKILAASSEAVSQFSADVDADYEITSGDLAALSQKILNK